METIGDCYVAATGIPVPMEQHALVMVRFAQDCLRKLPRDLDQLHQRLGGTTIALSMRVGLHSGPVTAGKKTND